MKVVGLISGGKDSIHNLLHCIALGHEVVALANLRPPVVDEMDSFMYQTVGHEAIELIAQAMELPLIRRDIVGGSVAVDMGYTKTDGDEVEDLYMLLQDVLASDNSAAYPDVMGVSVGAILSNYQRIRVEHVCSRLGLTSLAYLWQRNQRELLAEMIACETTAVAVKVAAVGLEPHKHLGKTLAALYPTLLKLEQRFEVHVCGEGGEYESLVVDSALYKKRISIDKSSIVTTGADVGHLRVEAATLIDKENPPPTSPAALTKLAQTILAPHFFAGRFDGIGGSGEEKEDGGGGGKDGTATPAPGAAPEAVNATLAESNYAMSKSSSSSATLHKAKGATLSSSSAYLFFAGLTASEDGNSGGNDDAAAASARSPNEEATSVMRQLKEMLAAHELSAADVMLVHLYVSSMATFAEVNTVYISTFGGEPPARVCLEARLPPNHHLMLECVCRRSSKVSRSSMHVQGISHWAPANIGPYSQAVKGGNGLLFMAGQIGLDPPTMELVAGGFMAEAKLALASCFKVMKADSMRSAVLSGVCFVTDISVAAQGGAGAKVWTEGYDAFLEETGHPAEGDGTYPDILYVQIPALPKAAAVEWNLVATDGAAVPRAPSSLSVQPRRPLLAGGAAGGDFSGTLLGGSYDAKFGNGFVTVLFGAAPTDARAVFGMLLHEAAALANAVVGNDLQVANLDGDGGGGGEVGATATVELVFLRVFYVAGAVPAEGLACLSSLQDVAIAGSMACSLVPASALEDGRTVAAQLWYTGPRLE